MSNPAKKTCWQMFNAPQYVPYLIAGATPCRTTVLGAAVPLKIKCKYFTIPSHENGSQWENPIEKIPPFLGSWKIPWKIPWKIGKSPGKSQKSMDPARRSGSHPCCLHPSSPPGLGRVGRGRELRIERRDHIVICDMCIYIYMIYDI